MRIASLASSLALLLSSAVLAAEGDALVVTGDGVNVRARPESGAPVLVQAYRDDRAVELAREGNWVQVRLPDRDTSGWIHGSLVAAAGARPAPVAVDQPPTTPAPAALPAPAAGPAPAPAPGNGAVERKPDDSQLAAVNGPESADPVARFRDSVAYLNNRAVAAAGIDLFTNVTERGNGVVQVTATDAWATVPEGGKQSFMNTLFDRWLAAAGAAQPLRVEVVDRTGQVLREKSGP